MTEPYFRLVMDKEVSRPISFGPLNKALYRYKMDRETFDRVPAFEVAYYKPEIGLEFCDFLAAPMLMVTTKFQELFTLLEPNIEFKGVQVYPQNGNSELPIPVYWIPYLTATECFHDSTVIYDTGIVKELVLREDALDDKPIVKAYGRAEVFWLFSLAAAECILRRAPLGIGLETVKVRK